MKRSVVLVATGRRPLMNGWEYGYSRDGFKSMIISKLRFPVSIRVVMWLLVRCWFIGLKTNDWSCWNMLGNRGIWITLRSQVSLILILKLEKKNFHTMSWNFNDFKLSCACGRWNRWIVKMLAQKDNDRILGIHIMINDAAESDSRQGAWYEVWCSDRRHTDLHIYDIPNALGMIKMRLQWMQTRSRSSSSCFNSATSGWWTSRMNQSEVETLQSVLRWRRDCPTGPIHMKRRAAS